VNFDSSFVLALTGSLRCPILQAKLFDKRSEAIAEKSRSTDGAGTRIF
jgi:hypothetical protein